LQLCYRIVILGDRYFGISTHMSNYSKKFKNVFSWTILTKRIE